MIKEHIAADPQGGVSHEESSSIGSRCTRRSLTRDGDCVRYAVAYVGERTRSEIPATNVEVDGIAGTWTTIWPQEARHASPEARH